jgi:methyltransferase family protein
MDQAEPSVVAITATKFFKYVRLTGLIIGDHLKSINVIDPHAEHLKTDLDFDYPHDDQAQEANGFCVELFRDRDDLDQDIEIEFVGQSGWSHRSSFFTLARMGKMRDATAILHGRFRERLEKMEKPTILDVGGRKRSEVDRRELFPGTNYIVFDILPGENVDIVGDAHELSRYVADATIDVFVSTSVFEHIAMPWKVVLELNKVLKSGGFGFVHTHQTLGLHDFPWDFWRFSDTAWDALFNAATGFRIIDRCIDSPQFVVPLFYGEANKGFERAAGFESSAVLVEKIGEARLEWPVSVKDITQTMYPR